MITIEHEWACGAAVISNQLSDTLGWAAFVKHRWSAQWPTRWFYDLMISTAIGEDNVISKILHAMLRADEGRRSMRHAS